MVAEFKALKAKTRDGDQNCVSEELNTSDYSECYADTKMLQRRARVEENELSQNGRLASDYSDNHDDDVKVDTVLEIEERTQQRTLCATVVAPVSQIKEQFVEMETESSQVCVVEEPTTEQIVDSPFLRFNR